jgi:hypothetical protein
MGVAALVLVASSLVSISAWRALRDRRDESDVHDMVTRARVEEPVTDLVLESGASNARDARHPIQPPTAASAQRASESPAITGCIVERGTRTPVPRAVGMFVMQCESGRTLSGLMCDERGRFRIQLACLPVRSVGITLASPGLGRVVIDLARVPDSGRDLGDLELEPANDVHFVATDAGGSPVAGAVACVDGPALVRSDPTASDGRGVLHSVLASTRSLDVEALGFEKKTARLDDESFLADSPLEIELVRRPALRVAVAAADGSTPIDVLVLVRCADGKPFVSDRGPSADPVQIALGAPRPRRRMLAQPSASVGASEPLITLAYAPDRNGKLFVPGLRPTCPLDVDVADKAGDVLASRRVDPSTLARRDEIVMRIARAPTELALRVLDADGAPVAGAEICRADGGDILGSSDRSGIASIGPLYGNRVSVIVVKSGCAPQRVSVSPLESPRVHSEVVLRPGRTVRVRVVDAHGDDATIDAITARFAHLVVGVQSQATLSNGGPGWGSSARSKDSNGSVREFRDLPFEPFDFVVAAGGRRIKEACAPDVEELVIALPAAAAPDGEIAPR